MQENNGVVEFCVIFLSLLFQSLWLGLAAPLSTGMWHLHSSSMSVLIICLEHVVLYHKRSMQSILPTYSIVIVIINDCHSHVCGNT